MELRILATVAGVALVTVTLLSAIRTFVLPRAAPVRISRAVFLMIRQVMEAIAPPSGPYERRDRVLAMLSPLALLTMPVVWLVLILAGFTGIWFGAGVDHLDQALAHSSASLTTLGFASPANTPEVLIATTEAVIGLGLVALLISYLPTIYAAFSRRERNVALLETAADSPPSPLALITRYHRIRGLDRLEELYQSWIPWFADVEESHTSIAALVFFRSPEPQRSWVTAVGCILDSAALTDSTLDIPRSPEPQLCLRTGFMALRRIAATFALPNPSDPSPGDPISITREEYDALCDQLAQAGVPLKPDREQAWRDFAGWRVNYDEVLRRLAGLCAAPVAMWSSDRMVPYHPPPLFVRRMRTS
ncbi:MAG TPA: hypothetical protein VI316_08245 [Candidatus Dormibacteraeota bacterium]